ncbi:MAG: hypothetical protein U9Q98_06020, partial [Bacteroidota bacterium]|nr:hypothetical protein [Bacteroidota bacterium]
MPGEDFLAKCFCLTAGPGMDYENGGRHGCNKQVAVMGCFGGNTSLVFIKWGEKKQPSVFQGLFIFLIYLHVVLYLLSWQFPTFPSIYHLNANAFVTDID